MKRSRRVLLALLVFVVATVPALPVLAVERAPWDQAKVTALAEQLARQMVEVYDAVYHESAFDAQVGSGSAFEYSRLKDRTRVAKYEAQHLAGALKKGHGYADTVHSFDRLMEVIRDARVAARRTFMDEQTLAKIKAARKTLSDLAPFYDPDTLEIGEPAVGVR